MIFRTRSSEMPYFGGYFGVDTHGRHLGVQVFKEHFVVASFALLVNLRLHNSQICYTQNVIFLINGNRCAYFDAILVIKS